MSTDAVVLKRGKKPSLDDSSSDAINMIDSSSSLPRSLPETKNRMVIWAGLRIIIVVAILFTAVIHMCAIRQSTQSNLLRVTKTGEEENVSELALTIPLNATSNPNMDWCPQAQCHKSPMCSSCHRRFLFIIATGRSGSTSMLRMLNELPNVRLSGENNNTMYGMHNVMARMLNNPAHMNNGKSEVGAWVHNEVRPSDLSCPVQHLFEAINPPPPSVQLELGGMERDARTILGFKEVRYHEGWKKEEDVVKFIRQYFPCSRIVINYRSDVASQAKSQWYQTDPNAQKTLRWINQRILRLANLFGNQAYVMDSSEWSLDTFNELASWLGFNGCEYSAIYRENNKGYDQDKQTQVSVGPNCRYVGANGTLSA